MLLDYLYYNIGKQQYDFELQILEKEGRISKRKKYSEICFDIDNKNNQWFIKKCNQRQILPNEIVLDLESKDQFNPIIKELKEMNIIFYVFSTGSRGYHIHLFFDRELTEKEKLDVIRHFASDEQLSSKRHMIALEFVSHWKSGKIKEMINNGN